MLNLRFIESWKLGLSPKGDILAKNSIIILDDGSYYAYKIHNHDEIIQIAKEYIEASSEQSRKNPYSIVKTNFRSYLPDDYYENENLAIVLECLHPEQHENYYFQNDDEIKFNFEKFKKDYELIYTDILPS
jgi:hypothetical protein